MAESNVCHIVVFKEEDMYVAQCLQHDVCVQAGDMVTLQRRFEVTVGLEGEAFRALPAAPDHFHQLWRDGLELESKVGNSEMRLAA